MWKPSTELLAYVQKEVEEKAAQFPEGLDSDQRKIYRDMMLREHKFWEQEARDYVYGWDEGVIV
jgi:hypothetical protein